MSRDEYLEDVGNALGFLDNLEKAEVLGDMAELYDGLEAQGLNSKEIQRRIGSAATVAAEYRFVEKLEVIDRSPGTVSGMRIGFAAMSGPLARGAAFPLLGLVLFSLAVFQFALGIGASAGLLFTAGALTGYDPIVTTLAVPGIPAPSGVFLGMAFTAASTALLLGNRLLMRSLSRLMRTRILRRRGAVPEPKQNRKPVRAPWLTALAALAFAALSAVLVLVLPAQEFPLRIDQDEPLGLMMNSPIDIRVRDVDVRITAGVPPSARLTADLRRTFAQSAGLEVDQSGPRTVVSAVYREGLSWGINPRPTLEVTIDPDRTAEIVIDSGGGEVDLTSLPEAMRERVRVRVRVER